LRRLDDNRGQLLMLAGIIITISILSLALVSISLSGEVSISKKNSFIKNEYDNVRTEFGVALKDRLVDLSNYNGEDFNTTIKEYILDTEDIFVFTENLDGYFFDVIFIKDNAGNDEFVIMKGSDKIGVKLNLFLTNGGESVYEESVEYIIW